MHCPTAFSIKLQLHFGGDIHEISVPAYGSIEPTVGDLMNVIEHSLRVPRALQNLIFHGQELHSLASEPLSRFGIRNGVPIRLVGRMIPPSMIDQINAQYGVRLHQELYSTKQSDTNGRSYINEQCLSYDYKQFKHPQNSSVGTQYDPPASISDRDQPLPTPDQRQASESRNCEEHQSPTTPSSSNTK